MDINTHISNLEALSELVSEALEDARNLQRVGVAPTSTTALSASTARVHHEFERMRPLPVGRVRQSPALPRMTREEVLVWGQNVLWSLDAWVAPNEWATQHHRDHEVAQCWRRRLEKVCRELHLKGHVERRINSRPGVTYEYRIIRDRGTALRAV